MPRARWLSRRISYKYICTNGVHARRVYGTHVAFLIQEQRLTCLVPRRAAESQLRRLEKIDDQERQKPRAARDEPSGSFRTNSGDGSPLLRRHAAQALDAPKGDDRPPHDAAARA